MQSRPRVQVRLIPEVPSLRRGGGTAASSNRFSGTSSGRVFPADEPLEDHMANDPYESRRGWRDPRASYPRDEFDRDERGFFERAGDEIASWFGDDESDGRRSRGDPERAPYGGGPGGNYGRDSDRSSSARQRFARDRDYRPMTGDYGRGEFERGRPMARGELAARYGYGSAHHGDTLDRGSSQRPAGRSGDRKSTRLNSSHCALSRMPSSA